MGLPKLTFTLKKAARTVAARTSQSVVALIIRDSKANGVHAIYQESDIPSTLGADNAAYIKRAMIGHINRPRRGLRLRDRRSGGDRHRLQRSGELQLRLPLRPRRHFRR